MWRERKTREKKGRAVFRAPFHFFAVFFRVTHHGLNKRGTTRSFAHACVNLSVEVNNAELSYLCSDIRVHASSQQDQYNVNSVLPGTNMQRSKSILYNSKTAFSVSTLSNYRLNNQSGFQREAEIEPNWTLSFSVHFTVVNSTTRIKFISRNQMMKDLPLPSR